MEFWGVVVKPGETVKCNPGEDFYHHLSQASLEEITGKGDESVTTFVKFDNKKFVLGTLSADKRPQIPYDVVFEKEYELSHSSKNTSVHFSGYQIKATQIVYSSTEEDSESEEDPLDSLDSNANDYMAKKAKPESKKLTAAKPSAPSSKPKVTAEKPKKSEEPKVDEDDSDEDDDVDYDEDDDSEEAESGGDEDMIDADDSSDEEDDESSDEDEATPQKNANGKKRPVETPLKTPARKKKAKIATPSGGPKTGGDGKRMIDADDSSDEEDDESSDEDEATPQKNANGKKRPVETPLKTPARKKAAKIATLSGGPKTGGDGKRSGPVHIDTPHPAKQAKMILANNDKSKQSTGLNTCKSCNKVFNSPMGLEAHSKAKHGATK